MQLQYTTSNILPHSVLVHALHKVSQTYFGQHLVQKWGQWAVAVLGLQEANGCCDQLAVANMIFS